MQEFRVNEFINLKLVGTRTEIYVNGEYFRQCKYLIVSIPVKEIEEWDHFDSMDEVIRATNKSLGGGEHHAKLTPEEAFWGHCSNLQAWATNGYDYRILDTRLSIPIILLILKGLIKEKNKEKFHKFFLEVVKSLDEYIINSRQNAYTYGRFKFFSKILFRTKDRYFTDEEISGSIILKYIYDEFLERSIKQKKQQKYLYHEGKLWGTGRDNLLYRHFLRRVRDHDDRTINSSEMDYLPYLYAKGEFTDCGSISIYRTNKSILVIRDEKGQYWKQTRW